MQKWSDFFVHSQPDGFEHPPNKAPVFHGKSRVPPPNLISYQGQPAISWHCRVVPLVSSTPGPSKLRALPLCGCWCWRRAFTVPTWKHQGSNQQNQQNGMVVSPYPSMQKKPYPTLGPKRNHLSIVSLFYILQKLGPAKVPGENLLRVSPGVDVNGTVLGCTFPNQITGGPPSGKVVVFFFFFRVYIGDYTNYPVRWGLY